MFEVVNVRLRCLWFAIRVSVPSVAFSAKKPLLLTRRLANLLGAIFLLRILMLVVLLTKRAKHRLCLSLLLLLHRSRKRSRAPHAGDVSCNARDPSSSDSDASSNREGGPSNDSFQGFRKKPEHSEWVTFPFHDQPTNFLTRARNRSSCMLRHAGVHNPFSGFLCWLRYRFCLNKDLRRKIHSLEGFDGSYDLSLAIANASNKSRYQVCVFL